jgi:CubicO group peptidase (beta-lactamase class C family)
VAGRLNSRAAPSLASTPTAFALQRPAASRALRPWRRSRHVQTVVRYASVTKHAFCAMVLSHPDAISLDDTLGQHLPELQEPMADVTVGRALDMSGGLPDTRECLSLLGLSVYTETKSGPLFDFLARQTRLNYEPGTEVSYSNTGYRLVEEALQRKGVLPRFHPQHRRQGRRWHSTP